MGEAARRLAIVSCAALIALCVASPVSAEDTWRRPHPGMRWLSRSLPSQQIDVLEVDLCRPGVRLRATGSSERRRTPSSFGTLVGAEAAVNGDFFSFATYAPSGLAMHAGTRWGGSDGNYKGQLVVGSRRVELYRHGRMVTPEPWMREIVGGHPTILRDGMVVTSTDPLCTARHPRTALGVSADRRMLYVAVVDGRATSRVGMTCAEVARLMREMGAVEALNLDGGGSSAMWIRGRGVVSNPSDGTQRVVANHLAIQANGTGGIPHCPIPNLRAELVEVGGGFPESRELVLAPGEEVTGYVRLRNTGITAWDPALTLLGTTNERDESSALAGPDWIDATRAAAINRAVANGNTGRFTFTVRAPDEPGTVRQHFGLIHGGRWFGDDGGPGDRGLWIEVTTLRPDGGMPVTIPDGGAGGSGGGSSGGASDADVAESDGGTSGGMTGGGTTGGGASPGGVSSGGCSAGGDGSAPAGAWLLVVVCCICVRRRRLAGALVLFVALEILTPVVPAVAQDTWSNPHAGIRRLYRRTGTPNRIHALYVDLCAAGVSVRATASGEKGRTPSSFATLVGAEAALNGDFFSTGYTPTGFAVGNGMRWHADSGFEGYIAFGRERAVLSPPAEVGGPSWITEAVGGRPHLVHDGEVTGDYSSASHCPVRNPRTAAGLTQDRNTLILVVVDGRSSTSAGVTCSELAGLMRGLGAHEAINLDGGGSSGMWVRGVGVVNAPSDGSQRVVANHIAVHADGSGDPGSCNWGPAEVLTLVESFDSSRTTDVDGDGRADLCVRSSAGFRCHLSASPEMDAVIPGPELSDATGWDAEARWATIRMGDIDGDGLADVCARAAEGVRCWRSTGTGFGDAIVGPELSDAVGWSVLMHATSLRLADFDGDGDDDVCARAGAGFRCYRSTGDGFDGAALGPDLSNATGWADASNYGTIQMGDVDGDGRADVCARADAGMRCWLSDGDGFPTMIDGPAWSDAAGFDHVSYWGTIRLLDVDGDSRADLCARTSEGFACHLSTGDGFGPAAMGPPLVDSSGWGDYDNYSTLRMADVDGDGSADLCGRSNSDFRCWLWDGAAHATTIVGPELSDASNWDEPQYFRTLRLADVTGDGLADICGRGGAGISCWPSTGDAFGEAVTGPELSDAVGWANDRYYGTLRLAGPRCTPREEICNDEDDDCDGIVDEDACAPGDGGTVPARDGGFAPGDDAGPIPPLADAGGGGGSMSGGCGCRVTAAGAFHPLWLAFVLLCWRVVRRRRADLSGRR